ncbi:BMP family ABC transporter substrate-binding protein [Streptomyces sp. SID8379]|uniref:BMP family lipoprotein n=1 Tax=unclassified Streptomyces TaxID=2593676 RepID=UPI0005BD1AC0|nr:MULTISPECIES: BMP family ABC transporter substrate-binding protein [unclassified Streptomyces]MYW68500.1 BMP family ABC transporter substrate-binding protein [Streptomyces sp. SID8379]
MRRSRTTRATRIAVAVTGLALAATACGGTSSEAGDDDGSAKENLGLAIAYDVGGKGDQSFNDSAYEGLEKAKTEFGYKTADQEPKDGESDDDKAQRLGNLAKAGYNPVVGIGYAYGPALEKVAKKYPKTTFGIVDSVVEGKNVASLVFAENESSYLAGVAAAKATKSNHVGFVGGVDNELINKFQAGFEQGIKDTKKGVKVDVQYLDEDPAKGFASPDLGEAAADKQLEDGADVIYHAAGLSGQGVIKAAAEKKKWVIGVDSDQYKQQTLAKYKDYILTSALKEVGESVYTLAKSVEDKKPLTGVQTFDLKVNGVGASESNPKFKEISGLADAVAKAKKGIVDGSIKVAVKPAK